MRGGGWGRAWVVVARGDEGWVAAKGAVRFTPGTVFKDDALVVPQRGQGRGRPAGGRVRGRGGAPPGGAEAQGGGRRRESAERCGWVGCFCSRRQTCFFFIPACLSFPHQAAHHITRTRRFRRECVRDRMRQFFWPTLVIFSCFSPLPVLLLPLPYQTIYQTITHLSPPRAPKNMLCLKSTTLNTRLCSLTSRWGDSRGQRAGPHAADGELLCDVGRNIFCPHGGEAPRLACATRHTPS